MIYIAKCCVFEPVGRIDSITTPINRIALFGRQIILSTSGGNYISIPINGTVSQYITETDLMTPVFNLNQDETYNGIYSNSVEFFFLPYPPQNTYLVLNVLHNADVLMSDSTLVIRFVDSNNFNITSINVPLNRRVDNSTITVPVPAISPPMISISKVVIENTNGQNIFVYGAHVITSVMPKQLLSAGDPRFAYSYLGTNSLAKIEAVDVYVSDNQHILGDETESYTAFKVYDMPESYDGYYNILITDKTFYLSLYSNGLDRVIGAVGTTIPNPGGSIVIDPPNNIYGFYYPKAKPVLLSVPRKAWFIPINPSRLISLINKSFYNTNYYVVQSVGGAVSPGPNDLQFNNRWDSPDGIGFYSDVSPQSYRMTLQSTGGGATFGNTVALLGHKLGLGDRAFIHGEIVFPYSATRTIDNNAKILSIAIGRGNASLTPYDLNSANEKIYPFFVIAWYPISDTYCIATPTKEKLYVLSGKDIINAGADVVLPFTLTVDFLTNRYILSIDVTNGQLSSYILSIGDRQYGDLDSFLNDTNVINSIVEFQNGSIFYVGESKMAGYGKDLVLAFSSVTDANNNSVDKSMLSYMPLIANLSNSSL
ncbi:MAG: hypothetical protein KatS3mg083_528 [Candidatus Dojkabacteria bacterium]|nr:MAG: hypothetical protein KatS3mg083_528 [Candidatus Dojkabacteria bacterium]